MDYHYEALDEKRFQRLCQALIMAEFPHAQCLPTGQPDGGRDAFLYHEESGNRKIIIFQVKFSQNPSTKDAHDAIKRLIETEKGKVMELIDEGISSYYFLTNVDDTAHLKTGSIDFSQEYLTEDFGIRSQVWWKSDLDRRLDQFSEIKWSYPEILRATDILPTLLNSFSDSSGQDFKRTLMLYLATQYDVESEVKFKQVDLRHNLIDLFVDLPIGHKFPLTERDSEFFYQHLPTDVNSYMNQLRFYDDSYDLGNGGPFEHAGLVAAFLLQMPLAISAARIILEGAPGQGKSTVTQFLCQINRIRLLGKLDEIRPISDQLKSAPVRIPFKLDLRDYATWLSGKHPFEGNSRSTSYAQESRSLDSFLVMHINQYSGGLRVSQDSLIRFLKGMHVVIILDGFDEVADVTIREQIVAEVSHAAERFELYMKSIQLIITSRPAAFASSPGFREDKWTHLKLADLRTSNILNYKDKWIKAQNLSQEESQLISHTLKEKLEQPHFGDLARNPMQLAILLHLIHVQGVALPEKRTSLYEEYMNLFFDREAAKSDVVRNNRDELLSIHGMLAWELHSQVENGNASGRMSESSMKKLMKDYLQQEGHPTDLVDVLFRGTVERIGALVSRVTEMFEFEVQPLREYFTARHLHQTAPYSPPGKERKGTRLDRFEALAQSLFWTNVTRFFCGFYNKGELSSLVDGITELASKNGHKLINQPRRLATMLLSDHVFSQVPRVTNRLIDFITKDPDFQRFYATFTPHRERELKLPAKVGRLALFEACKTKLEQEHDPCRRRALREIMAENGELDELKSIWKLRYENALMTCDPLHEAEDFGIINSFSVKEIRKITKHRKDLLVRWLVKSGQFESIDQDVDLHESAVVALLNGEIEFRDQWYEASQAKTSLQKLLFHLDPYRVASLLVLDVYDGQTDRVSLENILERLDTTNGQARRTQRGRDRLDSFAEFADSVADKDLIKLQSSLTPWSDLVDKGFAEVPGSYAMVRLAVIITASRAESEEGVWSNEEFRPTPGLVYRLFYARRMASNIEWWRDRLSNITLNSTLPLLGVLLVWGSPEVVLTLKAQVGKILDELSERDWKRVHSMIRLVVRENGDQRCSVSDDWFDEIWPTSPRLAFIVAGFLDDIETRRRASQRAFRTYHGADSVILRGAFHLELACAEDSQIDWDYIQRLSMQSHTVGACIWWSPEWRALRVPPAVVQQVLWNCTNHCLGLVAICEAAYSNMVAQSASKLSKMAEADSWFESPCSLSKGKIETI